MERSVARFEFTADSRAQVARIRNAFAWRGIGLGDGPVSWVGGRLILDATAPRFVLELAQLDLEPDSFVWRVLV